MKSPPDYQGIDESCHQGLAVLSACGQDEPQPLTHKFFAGGFTETITAFCHNPRFLTPSWFSFQDLSHI